MAAKAVENAGTGAASIDERCRSAPPCHLGRIDTERSPAPIDMRVEIDQPGHDEQSAHIDDLSTTGSRVAPDFGHLSVAERDVSRRTQWRSASPIRSFTARYVKVVTSGRTPPRCCATMRRISKGARC